MHEMNFDVSNLCLNKGVSVTQRINRVKQPYGGYVPIKSFDMKSLGPGENELLGSSVAPAALGSVIDYLTRFMLGCPIEEAFSIPWLGAHKLLQQLDKDDGIDIFNVYDNALHSIVGLDDTSIINAYMMVGLDGFQRADQPIWSLEEMRVDEAALANTRLLVERSLSFFEKYGPVTKFGFVVANTMSISASSYISGGDGDFLTQDCVWDFKVSKNKPTSKHTLQLLVYYLMGLYNDKVDVRIGFDSDNFKSKIKLGIYNPRLNCVYTKDIASVDLDVLRIVSKDVIGYDFDVTEYLPEWLLDTYVHSNDDIELIDAKFFDLQIIVNRIKFRSLKFNGIVNCNVNGVQTDCFKLCDGNGVNMIIPINQFSENIVSYCI